MSIKKELFGITPEGCEIYKYTLKNASGMKVQMINYGAALVSLTAPDKNGVFADILGGFDTLDSYLNAKGYQGAVVGRFANRVAGGRFTLDGVQYQLVQNQNGNHLHGGEYGLDKRVWNSEAFDLEEPEVSFSYVSPDGEQGYPGELSVKVTYKLLADNAISISYRATTDKKTIINLTNHSYFNLAGYDSGSVLDQEMMLDADTFLPTDKTLIPTGEMRDVTGTPFDFRSLKRIGDDIYSDYEPIVLGTGYDHCFNFVGGGSEAPIKRAELYDKVSGRVMEMYTDMPCAQICTGNYLGDPNYPFKGGVPQKQYGFVCIEAQCMPDSINHEGFTNTVLCPGEIFESTTIYKFTTK